MTSINRRREHSSSNSSSNDDDKDVDLYSEFTSDDASSYIFRNSELIRDKLYNNENSFPNMEYYNILKRFILERPRNHSALESLDSAGLSNEIFVLSNGFITTNTQENPIYLGIDTKTYSLLNKINNIGDQIFENRNVSYLNKTYKAFSCYNSSINFFLTHYFANPTYKEQVDRIFKEPKSIRKKSLTRKSSN